VGRLDFKSSLRRSDPVVGVFDSHTPPPVILAVRAALAETFCFSFFVPLLPLTPILTHVKLQNVWQFGRAQYFLGEPKQGARYCRLRATIFKKEVY